MTTPPSYKAARPAVQVQQGKEPRPLLAAERHPRAGAKLAVSSPSWHASASSAGRGRAQGSAQSTRHRSQFQGLSERCQMGDAAIVTAQQSPASAGRHGSRLRAAFGVSGFWAVRIPCESPQSARHRAACHTRGFLASLTHRPCVWCRLRYHPCYADAPGVSRRPGPQPVRAVAEQPESAGGTEGKNCLGAAGSGQHVRTQECRRWCPRSADRLRVRLAGVISASTAPNW